MLKLLKPIAIVGIPFLSMSLFIGFGRQSDVARGQSAVSSSTAEASSAGSRPGTAGVGSAGLPFGNPTANQATYVGREVCGECHKENYDLHSKHGHSHTFFETSETGIPDLFAGKSFDAGDYGIYEYALDEAGELTVRLKGEDSSEGLPIQYVLGSGFNAQTFMTLRMDANRATEAVEHRVSCYRDERLDVTVGHEMKTSPDSPEERYGFLVRGEVLNRCIHCHTTTAEVKAGKITDLTAHVNCEKCHGPGSEHVRQARASESPPAYSVGKATWDAESEIQLCGDCHRLPRSVSKLELRDYPDSMARFQPVGLLRSRCYLESGFQLKCSTCHNPHQSNHGEGQKVDQVANCVSCHDQAEDTHVICPVSATDNCIECHMPALDQKQGIKFHDHWIRVRD